MNYKQLTLISDLKDVITKKPNLIAYFNFVKLNMNILSYQSQLFETTDFKL